MGRAELATLRVLARQLSAICRGSPVSRPRTALARLSERQKQVVRLVADGLSNAQIAETLWLAEDTVKKYVSRILSTTGCQSRTELALLGALPHLTLGAHRVPESRQWACLKTREIDRIEFLS